MKDRFAVVLLSENEIEKYMIELRLRPIHPNWFRVVISPEPDATEEASE